MKVTVIARKNSDSKINDFLTPDFDMIAISYTRFGIDRLARGRKLDKAGR